MCAWWQNLAVFCWKWLQVLLVEVLHVVLTHCCKSSGYQSWRLLPSATKDSRLQTARYTRMSSHAHSSY